MLPPRCRIWAFEGLAALLTTGLIALGLWLVFAPGFFDNDTYRLLWQADRAWFDDYNPALIGVLWRALWNPEAPSLAPLFITQSLALGLALHLAARQLCSGPWTASAVAVATLCVPGCLGYAGSLIKDVWFLVFLLLLVVVLRAALRTRRWVWLPALLILSLLTCHMRLNALTAILPLVICAAYCAVRAQGSQRTVAWACAGLLGIAPWLANPLIHAMIARHYRLDFVRPEQQLILFDLAGLSLERGEMLIPEAFNPDKITIPQLAERFDRSSNVPILKWVRPKKFGFAFNFEPGPAEELKRLWLREIARSPADYARVRARLSTVLLGFDDRPIWYYHEDKISANEWNFHYDPGVIGQRVMGWLESLRGTAITRAWFYLIVLAAGLGLWCLSRERTREFHFALLLLCSALGYFGSLFITAPSAGFRYVWPVAVIAVLLFWSGLTAQLMSLWAARRRTHPQP